MNNNDVVNIYYVFIDFLKQRRNQMRSRIEDRVTKMREKRSSDPSATEYYTYEGERLSFYKPGSQEYDEGWDDDVDYDPTAGTMGGGLGLNSLTKKGKLLRLGWNDKYDDLKWDGGGTSDTRELDAVLVVEQIKFDRWIINLTDLYGLWFARENRRERRRVEWKETKEKEWKRKKEEVTRDEDNRYSLSKKGQRKWVKKEIVPKSNLTLLRRGFDYRLDIYREERRRAYEEEYSKFKNKVLKRNIPVSNSPSVPSKIRTSELVDTSTLTPLQQGLLKRSVNHPLYKNWTKDEV